MYKNPQNKDEVLRYLGYRGQELDETTKTLVNESMEEMRMLINERYDYKFFNICRNQNKLSLENSKFILGGEDIEKHLSKSEDCILLAVTLGHQVDRKIRYYEKVSMTKALILDACASVAIEEICDRICSEIEKKLLQKNKALTSRYSPGYGDLPLDMQNEFLRIMGAEKSIGLTSTFNSILIPRKSVTAIIGVINRQEKKQNKGCLNCNKYSTCSFRKGDGKNGS